jgi:hypothetical protein
MAASADASAKAKVLVTGGTGLVGKGVEEFVASDEYAQANETYIFLSSKVDTTTFSLDDAQACSVIQHSFA